MCVLADLLGSPTPDAEMGSAGKTAWSPNMADVYRNPPEYTDRLIVRVKSAMPRALEVAAEKNRMSVSEYVRRSVIDRLKADGIDPAALAGAA